MTRGTVIIPVVLAMGCSLGEPDNPNFFDPADYQDQVEAIFGGTFTGTVAEGEELPDPSSQTPCAIASQPFTIESELEAGDCTTKDFAGDSGWDDCSAVGRASYAIEGALDVGHEAPLRLWGYAILRADDDAPFLFGDLYVDTEDFPRDNFLPDQSGPIDSLVIEGFSWQRRLTEDGADESLWEMCSLPVGEHTS